jgi:hypothetical protein
MFSITKWKMLCQVSMKNKIENLMIKILNTSVEWRSNIIPSGRKRTGQRAFPPPAS